MTTLGRSKSALIVINELPGRKADAVLVADAFS